MVPEDVDNLLKILSDPVAMKHYPQVYDRESTQQLWMQRNFDRYARDGHGFFMCELKSTGEFVGQCGLLTQGIDGVNELEVGYLFVRAHWGQGYATEAARACRDHGFRTYPVSHIISIIDPKNTPSIRVAQRNGMTLWKDAMFKGFMDHIFRITREEWEAVYEGDPA
jgi:RimJ/RimL family protein N-acetyltransferase